MKSKYHIMNRISDLTKIYNEIKDEYNIAIGNAKDYKTRRINRRYNKEVELITEYSNGIELHKLLLQQEIENRKAVLSVYKTYSPVVLREIKYEIRNLQRELSSYIKK